VGFGQAHPAVLLPLPADAQEQGRRFPQPVPAVFPPIQGRGAEDQPCVTLPLQAPEFDWIAVRHPLQAVQSRPHRGRRVEAVRPFVLGPFNEDRAPQQMAPAYFGKTPHEFGGPGETALEGRRGIETPMHPEDHGPPGRLGAKADQHGVPREGLEGLIRPLHGGIEQGPGLLGPEGEGLGQGVVQGDAGARGLQPGPFTSGISCGEPQALLQQRCGITAPQFHLARP